MASKRITNRPKPKPGRPGGAGIKQPKDGQMTAGSGNASRDKKVKQFLQKYSKGMQ